MDDLTAVYDRWLYSMLEGDFERAWQETDRIESRRRKGEPVNHGLRILNNAESIAADLIETAAAIMRCDVVLTVDTMVAHLAGALAKPVWVLLHFNSDWRWMLKRSDSPWYPTMRLFRQHSPGDWSRPIEQAKEELRKFVLSPPLVR